MQSMYLGDCAETLNLSPSYKTRASGSPTMHTVLIQIYTMLTIVHQRDLIQIPGTQFSGAQLGGILGYCMTRRTERPVHGFSSCL